ncbi:transglycosylase domain-containing protein [Anaerotignum propionicum]|uniref:Penicillin-binding protein 1A n=1 Tax=Anaerotignum propionicum DSM 1682 TaxID=991789 RepID=A0A0X1U7P6_ANAPI|nr:PBP1A family penicillin-binding protein [Anaerotignum propionicum]AMJ40953.1 penicillin-binding protein 1A [Anaerotignum propionicum DSM 1682]SHE59653.1 penicillin-binding protein 1A [[Clostridium] propionicum DSM 1682] [Anaerotignum propionicum DSM 1682]
MSETHQRRRPPEGAPRSSSSSRSTRSNPRKKKRRKRKGGSSGFFKVLLAIAVIVGFAVVGAGLGTVFGILNGTDMLNTEDVTPESYTSIIYDAKGDEFDKLHGDENREYVKLAQIAPYMQEAVIAIEDERFYDHNGIDMRGIMRATIQNIRHLSLSQGASTLTQQLIKNEVLTNEKTFVRKVKEQYLAVSFEKSLAKQLGSKKAAKDYILELYLNTIGLSHGLNGVEAAAQYYYGKNASELTLAESAVIAGITKNPSQYAPDTKPEKSKERQTTILKKMLDLSYITQGEYDQAVAEDVFSTLVCSKTEDDTKKANHNYFVEAMIAQVANDLVEKKGYKKAQAYDLIYSGGLQIYSTMDAAMQNTMEVAFTDDSLFPASDGTLDVTYLISVMDTTNPDTKSNQSHYERKTTVTSEDQVDAFVESVKKELLDDTHVKVLDKVTTSRSLQAAMVIMDQHNGQVKALVGGRGQKPGDSVFNRATQALRQQGSAMKPLASYAPAIDMGLLMPGSVIIDEPVTYGSWSPRNWNGRFLGPCTVRQGIRDSMNILAIKTFMMVGAESSFKYMESFGLSTLVDADKAATTALGGLTQGISVLEGTAAYAAIANGGIYNEPQYYTVVYDHDGNVLLDNSKIDTHRVIKETTAYMLTDMMKDVITGGGSATGHRAAISGMTVAGKTGTTNDTKDLTFYGYTPYYTAGIWMGYDTSKVIANGGSAHLNIWRTVMSQVHQGLSNKGFTKPSGLVNQSYCSACGGIATDLCGQDYYGLTAHTDIAAADFKGPGEVCTVHKVFSICKESGKLASDNCPASSRMDVVLAVDEKGKILSKPSKIPEGKMDINIKETCDYDHTNSPPPFEDNLPIDNGGWGGNNGNSPGTNTPGDTNYDDGIPDENTWQNNNFGIN